jgi:exonuclease III
VRQVITTIKPDLIYLQETKIENMDASIIRSSLGNEYDNNFVSLPTKGTRGGILIAARHAVMHLSNKMTTNHTISALVKDIRSDKEWMITAVYGPQGGLDKKMFIREMRKLKVSAKPEWLLIGDFNLIYKGQDKSNDHLNRPLMSRFKRVIDYLEVKEIDLIGKNYLEQ